jgi:high-affinity iron transporter
VFANFLIGLREGLEAALVVSILVAYLVRTGNRDRLRPIWAGVGVAVALSLAVGAVLTFTSNSLSFEAQELFGGVLSLVAVAFVTWMVFWMRRAARGIKRDLEGRLETALSMGTRALVVTAFVAVAREGLETAVFLWSAVQAAAQEDGSTTAPVIGGTLGLLTAVVLGYLLYRRAVTLNLARFFTVTGAALVVVAAGVLAYGFHDLLEAGVLSGSFFTREAFDVSAAIPPSSWYGTLLKGTLNFRPNPTVFEAGAYLAYLVPTLWLFFRGGRRGAAAPAAATPSASPATLSR